MGRGEKEGFQPHHFAPHGSKKIYHGVQAPLPALDKVLEDEEEMWRLRSRSIWLKL